MAKQSFSETKERDPLSLFVKKSHSWALQYFRPFLFLLIASISIFGFSLFYSYWQKRENKNSEELLYQARKELSLAEKKAGGNILNFDSGQNFFEQAKKAKYNSEINERVNKYINRIDKWIAQPSGLLSAMEMVYFLRKYEKSELAMELLNKAVLHKKKNMVGFLVALQAGTYLMDQGEYDKAITNFQFITKSEKAKWLWPMTLTKTALCYEKQNKWDQAKEVYKRVKSDFSDSLDAETAGQYLNLLKLRMKMDNQFWGKKVESGKDVKEKSKPSLDSAKKSLQKE